MKDDIDFKKKEPINGFNVINHPNSNIFSIKLGENIVDIERLDWDSEILSKKIYRIQSIKLEDMNKSELIKKFLDVIKSNFKIDCLIYKTEFTNFQLIELLQKNNFIIIGIPVRLDIDLNQIDLLNKDGYNSDFISDFRKEDVELLAGIARDSFLHAYRYNDKNLDKNKVDDLYGSWIRNSCMSRADKVFVYLVNDAPEGFIACNLKNGYGLIDLISVSKDFRGKGIGEKLVLHSLLWFKNKGLSKVEVNTEGTNYSSLRIYQKNSFKIVGIGVNLSYWFN